MGHAASPQAQKQWSQLIMDWNLQNCKKNKTFSFYKLIISGIVTVRKDD
jgi:hypothetical protein